ncbi:MAG: zinc-ribbon domain-containing protein [Clostridiales bacterium]|jgi:hypothetical protein|nr:zinc-ribbon domain-containing protein [Clostridiales bacterium]
MKQFDCLYEAAKSAATLSARWRFATSDEQYDTVSLLSIAETSDAENPTDEDSYYVVSPGGAIGFCENGEEIDWLFLPDSGTAEPLPGTVEAAPQIKYCPKCGSGIIPGAHFCGKCGARLC